MLKEYVCYYQHNPHVKRIHSTQFKDLTKVVSISHTTAKNATFMRIVVQLELAKILSKQRARVCPNNLNLTYLILKRIEVWLLKSLRTV